MRFAPRYDVVVSGGGPAGTITAIAFAKRGARVLVLESNPRASSRLAGEWLHPAGVQVATDLGIDLSAVVKEPTTGRGFVVYADDEADPVVLTYPRGMRGLSVHHEALVAALREHVASVPDIIYAPHARVSNIEDRVVQFEHEHQTHKVTADWIIGADGRSSTVRKFIPDSAHAQTSISSMAGLELRDTELPYEEYGHLVLGGAGPVLIYRISRAEIRIILDVRKDPSKKRSAENLLDDFCHALPKKLQPSFVDACRGGKIHWAANGFRPRTCYGAGHTALVGDAVGHLHPLTAAGMSLAFLDAECIARTRDLAAFKKERELASYVPELLSNGLYQAFVREDGGPLRAAIAKLWRTNAAERDRSMELLSITQTSAEALRSVFLGVLATAFMPPPWGELRPLATSLLGLGQFSVAALAPDRIRQRCRTQSTPTTPLPLRMLAP
jgi:2-polyprenyl-6-methoxyphenol hydroxylase-like FAD-dependent oxidoreductase